MIWYTLVNWTPVVEFVFHVSGQRSMWAYITGGKKPGLNSVLCIAVALGAIMYIMFIIVSYSGIHTLFGYDHITKIGKKKKLKSEKKKVSSRTTLIQFGVTSDTQVVFKWVMDCCHSCSVDLWILFQLDGGHRCGYSPDHDTVDDGSH